MVTLLTLERIRHERMLIIHLSQCQIKQREIESKESKA